MPLSKTVFSDLLALGEVFAEEVVEFGVGDGVVEAGEVGVEGDAAGSVEEAGPCGSGEGGAYADAADSDGGEVVELKVFAGGEENVDGFGCDGATMA